MSEILQISFVVFVLVDVSMCTFRIAVYGRLKYVVT